MRETIVAKVVQEIENLAGKKIPDPDYNIFSLGFLDSLNAIHIIIFMEKEFDIHVNPFDLSIDVLNSVNKIVDFIESKINQ